MMKIDFKKPWQIWPFQSYGMVKKDALIVTNSGDFTMSVSFKSGDLFDETELGGICLRPGMHSGFMILKNKEVRFDIWFNDGTKNNFVCLKKQINDSNFFNEFNTLTITFSEKENRFSFYVNSVLEDSVVINGKYNDYNNLPIFFGCGAYDWKENTNFMECYYDFFLLCDSIVDIDDVIHLKNNLYDNLNEYEYIKNKFSNNIVVCYDFIKKTPHKVWDFSGNSNYLIKVEETC